MSSVCKVLEFLAEILYGLLRFEYIVLVFISRLQKYEFVREGMTWNWCYGVLKSTLLEVLCSVCVVQWPCICRMFCWLGTSGFFAWRAYLKYLVDKCARFCVLLSWMHETSSKTLVFRWLLTLYSRLEKDVLLLFSNVHGYLATCCKCPGHRFNLYKLACDCCMTQMCHSLLVSVLAFYLLILMMYWISTYF